MITMFNTAEGFRRLVGEAGSRLSKLGHTFRVTSYVAGVREVAERLTAADLSVLGIDKLPAAILVRDYLEEFEPGGDAVTVSHASILLIAHSAADYTSEERERKVFIPTLYPFLSAFLSAAVDAGCLSPSAEVQKIDRHRISGALNEVVLPVTGRSLFNDQLDGIELRGLSLSFDCNNFVNN